MYVVRTVYSICFITFSTILHYYYDYSLVTWSPLFTINIVIYQCSSDKAGHKNDRQLKEVKKSDKAYQIYVACRVLFIKSQLN